MKKIGKYALSTSISLNDDTDDEVDEYAPGEALDRFQSLQRDLDKEVKFFTEQHKNDYQSK